MNTDSLPKLTVTSSAFEQGALIPSMYTCDGEGVSPTLSWNGAPEETQSFVLIKDINTILLNLLHKQHF